MFYTFRLGRRGYRLGVWHNSNLEHESPLETVARKSKMPKAAVDDIIISG
jgi:hypothetical protein